MRPECLWPETPNMPPFADGTVDDKSRPWTGPPPPPPTE
jgi:hypothetical protein